MNKKQKMNTKNLLVSFLTIVSVLFLVATVSAHIAVTGDLANEDSVLVKVNDINVDEYEVSVIAGETVKVTIYFTADIAENSTSDVKIKAEIEGDKVDIDSITDSFDVENGYRYRKTLTLKVPSELKDEKSGEVTLSLKIWNGDYKTELENDIVLQVQRPSYNADIKSVSVSNSVEAGENLPVDIVLKNMGYNDLDDVFVTVRISALDIEKTAYFGDLVVEEVEDDDEDTANGRLNLKIPFDAQSGIYALEIEVSNDDTITSVVKQIIVNNDFSNNVIVSTQSRTVAVGENAEYSLLVVNPTNKLKIYKIVPESSGDVSSDVKETVIAVPAGSSKTVRITANALSEGRYTFNTNIFSGEELVSTVTLDLNTEGKSAVTSPIVVMTVILVIIFLVLLVVLITLLGKKPEKSEDLGESYY